MKIIDIKTPEFRIIADQNMHVLDLESRKSVEEGWYPIGGQGRRKNDWIQVMVKEKIETE